MIKWEYHDYRPEGFEVWKAEWGEFYSISINKIGEQRYTVRWYYKGITDIKKHIDAKDWDEAKAFGIAIVKDSITKRAEYWRDMKIGFTNWISEE